MNRDMEKLPTTIEDLAAMINTHMASKEDIKEVKQDVAALRSEMKTGFDRIENLLLAEQKREIEDLKKRMKRLEDVLAV
jgi:predicted DNA-binding ArsR family transcriptional regulator